MADDLSLLRNLGNGGQSSDVLASVDAAYSLPLFSLRWLDRGFDAMFGQSANLTKNFVSTPSYWRR